jgi:hypothetical protein
VSSTIVDVIIFVHGVQGRPAQQSYQTQMKKQWRNDKEVMKIVHSEASLR